MYVWYVVQPRKNGTPCLENRDASMANEGERDDKHFIYIIFDVMIYNSCISLVTDAVCVCVSAVPTDNRQSYCFYRLHWQSINKKKYRCSTHNRAAPVTHHVNRQQCFGWSLFILWIEYQCLSSAMIFRSHFAFFPRLCVWAFVSVVVFCIKQD